MLVFVGLDGSRDGEAPAGGGERIVCCVLAPGGWLSVMGEASKTDLRTANPP